MDPLPADGVLRLRLSEYRRFPRADAIDAAAAEPMTEKFEAYRAMESAFAGMDDSAMDLDMEMTMNMVMEMDGETMEIPAFTTGNVKTILDESDMEIAYTMNTSAEGTEVEIGMWMKDGWMYMTMEAEGETMKVKAPIEDELAMLEEINTVDVSAMNVSGLAMIDSISVKKAGSNTEYTMVIGQNMGGMMDSVAAMTGEDAAGMNIGDMEITYAVDRNDTLKRMSMVFSAGLAMPLPNEDGTLSSVNLQYDYEIDMTINATGSRVKITYPDFSDFVEISAEEMDAIT